MFSALRLDLAATDQVRAAPRDRDAELAILDATASRFAQRLAVLAGH